MKALLITALVAVTTVFAATANSEESLALEMVAHKPQPKSKAFSGEDHPAHKFFHGRKHKGAEALAELAKAMKQAHPKLGRLVKNLHTMKAQQSATCDANAFQSEAVTLLANCPATQDGTKILSGPVTTAEMDAICSNNCPQQFIDFVNKFPTCLGDPQAVAEAAAGLELIMIACEKEGGVYCGVKLAAVNTFDCDTKLSSSTCEAQGMNCHWHGSTCEISATTTTLDAVCGSCLNKLMKAITSLTPVGFRTSAKLAQILVNELLCKKIQGEYCMVAAAAEIEASGTLFNAAATQATTQTFLTNVCQTSLKRACFRSVVSVGGKLAFVAAADVYTRCVGLSSSSFVRAGCFSTFALALATDAVLQQQLKWMCSANHQGSYCLGVARDVIQSHTTCLALLSTGTCSSSCDTSLKGWVDTVGCCGHAIDQLFNLNNVQIDPALIPTEFLPSTNAPRPSDWQMWTQHTMYDFTYCTSVNTTDYRANMTAGCPSTAPATPPEVRVGLRIKYAVVEANADYKRTIMGAMRQDLASVMAVSPSQLVNDTIAENTAVTISGRHMHAQQSTASSSGILYTAKLAVLNAEDGTAATSAFQNALSSGALDVVTTTSVAIADCPASTSSGCVAVGPLVDESSSGSSGGGGGGSGATAVSFFVAMFVAMIAGLML